MACGITFLLVAAVFAVSYCNADLHTEPLDVSLGSTLPVPQASGSGVHCYVCNSVDEPECNDSNNLKKKFVKECEPKDGRSSVGCWMIQQYVNYDQTAELKQHERTIRQCAYHVQPGSSCIYRSGFGSQVTHCFCNSTACNFGSNVQSNPILTIVSSFLFIIIMKAFV